MGSSGSAYTATHTLSSQKVCTARLPPDGESDTPLEVEVLAVQSPPPNRLLHTPNSTKPCTLAATPDPCSPSASIRTLDAALLSRPTSSRLPVLSSTPSAPPGTTSVLSTGSPPCCVLVLPSTDSNVTTASVGQPQGSCVHLYPCPSRHHTILGSGGSAAPGGAYPTHPSCPPSPKPDSRPCPDDSMPAPGRVGWCWTAVCGMDTAEALPNT
mmetsp:Transcript_42087/g.97565  ORF Transcript_42087/g.97565 Transcript_42087/m.97565 type:complete len:212 (-) Transcript_42087:313-948(-)